MVALVSPSAPPQSPQSGQTNSSSGYTATASLTRLSAVERMVLIGRPVAELSEITIGLAETDTGGRLNKVSLKGPSNRQAKILNALAPGSRINVVLALADPSIQFGPFEGRIAVAKVDYDSGNYEYRVVPNSEMQSPVSGGRRSTSVSVKDCRWANYGHDYSTRSSRFREIVWNKVQSDLQNLASTSSREKIGYEVKVGSTNQNASVLALREAAEALSDHIPVINNILTAIHQGQERRVRDFVPFGKNDPVEIDFGKEMFKFLDDYTQSVVTSQLTIKQLLFCRLVNEVSALAEVMQFSTLEADSHVASIGRVLEAIESSRNDNILEFVPEQFRANFTKEGLQIFLHNAKEIVNPTSNQPIPLAIQAISLLEQLTPSSFPPR